MGKVRDKLIRRLGGTPVSDENPSDAELMARRLAWFAQKGQLPPEVEGIRSLLVGYGTLLSRKSVAHTVGKGAYRKPFIPVIVPGFRRLFNLRPDHYEPSLHLTQEPTEVAAMNVIPSEGERFNGLAFPVSEEDLSVLDERERYYQRIRVPIVAFTDGQSLGEAWTYSAPPGAPAVFEASAGLHPRWRDVVVAREGANAISEAFGTMFDETTYMADGQTLVAHEYREHLPDLGPN